MIRDYSNKTADEWFALKKWTGFLVQLQVDRPFARECESVRDILAIRAKAAALVSNPEFDRKISVKTDPYNEKIVIVETKRK